MEAGLIILQDTRWAAKVLWTVGMGKSIFQKVLKKALSWQS
jgi:hypothetical protein